MNMIRTLLMIISIAWPATVAAQSAESLEHKVAVGGDVGFLAPDNGEATVFKTATGHGDAFVEYYATDRWSLRGMYGWANLPFDSTAGRFLRRQHVNVNVLFNWRFGAFRPFAAIGGGAYFFSQRENGETVDSGFTKPGGSLGWGGEYHFRTFAVKSEMNVHILSEEETVPDFQGNTLAGFTWTFGIKVPF